MPDIRYRHPSKPGQIFVVRPHQMETFDRLERETGERVIFLCNECFKDADKFRDDGLAMLCADHYKEMIQDSQRASANRARYYAEEARILRRSSNA